MSFGIERPAPDPIPVSRGEAIANWAGALSLLTFINGIIMIFLGTLYSHDPGTNAYADGLAYGGVGLAGASLIIMASSAYVLKNRATPYFSTDTKELFLLLLIGAVGGLLIGASFGFNQTSSAMAWTGVSLVTFSGVVILAKGLITLAHLCTKRDEVHRVARAAAVAVGPLPPRE